MFRFALLLPIALLAAPPSAAAGPNATSEKTVDSRGAMIEFTLEVGRPLASDLFRASAVIESSDPDADELRQRVNAGLSAARTSAKTYPAIKIQPGGSRTQAVYGKTGRSVESWKMRSELQFESSDAGQLAELLAKLQSAFTVSRISAHVSPSARRQTEEELSSEAIKAFGERARKIAGAMQKNARIKQMQLRDSKVATATEKTGNEAPGSTATEQWLGIVITGQIELSE